LPVGAKILSVLTDIPSVLSHVLAVLAQIALVASELPAILLHLRVGRRGRRLCAHARRPSDHRKRSEQCHCLPLAHVVLPCLAFPPPGPPRPRKRLFPGGKSKPRAAPGLP